MQMNVVEIIFWINMTRMLMMKMVLVLTTIWGVERTKFLIIHLIDLIFKVQLRIRT